MIKNKTFSALVAATVVCFADVSAAQQITIDFDNVGAPGSFHMIFPGFANGPVLTYPDVTLDGAVILNHFVFGTAATTGVNIYATCDTCTLGDGPPGTMLPGVISGTLNSPAQSLRLDVINGTAANGTYTLTAFDSGGAVIATDAVVLTPYPGSGVPLPANPTFVQPLSVAVAGIESFTVTTSLSGYTFAIDTVVFDLTEPFSESCNGDGGDQMGCTNCPCANNAAPGTIGGCLNSANTSARLAASGSSSVSLPSGDTTDLRFSISGVPGNAFCILNSGDGVAPGNMANPCFGMNSGAQAAAFDGLRCAIQNTRRHGGRSADANGDVGATNAPWGGEGGPPVGLAVAGGGFVSGQTRYFQVINRDDPLLVCNRGLNTSQAIEVIFTP